MTQGDRNFQTGTRFPGRVPIARGGIAQEIATLGIGRGFERFDHRLAQQGEKRLEA